MGKASFLRLRDKTVGNEDVPAPAAEGASAPAPQAPQNLQLYVRKDVVNGADWTLMKSHLDIGDIVGVRGRVFVTRTGEPTLMVDELVLLTKSLRPLPEKFHGLSDLETRFRQRYVDLIVNAKARRIFKTRALIVEHVRRFLGDRGYMEVETPMMQVIPGGATARPFVTHHNALDMPLYLRIAPELYLKRLLVGGLERVFEVNRNFRNEGLSPRHNPEFTMLEFYQAYATYEDLIALTEELLSGIAARLADDEGHSGDLVRPYGDHAISWAKPFARYSVKESLTAVGGLADADVANVASLAAALHARKVEVPKNASYGQLLVAGFEGLVEHRLIQPTFITHYPVENSPLARRNEVDPTVTDRFELFVAGLELANAFSELNDPIDQRQRFESQVAARQGGDDEAMYMDLDYVRALEYGMPPAAGEGIGIDRLVMMMTDQQSIREVILFPHMRPEIEQRAEPVADAAQAKATKQASDSQAPQGPVRTA
jgi:lysyl-tRNA synthetase class 2